MCPSAGNAIADAHRAYCVTDGLDTAHELVADDARRMHALLRPMVPRVDVVVGPADAGFFDADEHVGRSDRGNRNLFFDESGLGAHLAERAHRLGHTQRHV